MSQKSMVESQFHYVPLVMFLGFNYSPGHCLRIQFLSNLKCISMRLRLSTLIHVLGSGPQVHQVDNSGIGGSAGWFLARSSESTSINFHLFFISLISSDSVTTYGTFLEPSTEYTWNCLEGISKYSIGLVDHQWCHGGHASVQRRWIGAWNYHLRKDHNFIKTIPKIIRNGWYKPPKLQPFLYNISGFYMVLPQKQHPAGNGAWIGEESRVEYLNGEESPRSGDEGIFMVNHVD